MTVDYLLLIISIFLLVRELFPSTDRFNPKARKILYIAIIGLLLILSIINIYTTNEENTTLIDNSKEILRKTNDLNDGLEKNLKAVSESSTEIGNIKIVLDSVKDSLANQVIELNDIIKTSKEFTELKKKEFESERPRLETYIKDTLITFDNAGNLTDVSVDIINHGQRTATDVTCFSQILYYHKVKNGLKNIEIDEKIDENDFMKLGDVFSFQINGSKRFLKTKIKANSKMFELYDSGFVVVISLKYKDQGGREFKETFYLVAQNYKNKKFEYSKSTSINLTNLIQEYYLNNGYEEYLYN